MIGGNITATIQISSTTRNKIGEAVKTWKDIQDVTGWLEYQAGDSRYNNYNAKIQESTHVFVADYVELDPQITAENSQMVVNGKEYDIILIDNPMELNKQLEFYLKFTGGQ